MLMGVLFVFRVGCIFLEGGQCVSVLVVSEFCGVEGYKYGRECVREIIGSVELERGRDIVETWRLWRLFGKDGVWRRGDSCCWCWWWDPSEEEVVEG